MLTQRSVSQKTARAAFTPHHTFHTQGNAYDLSKMGLVRQEPGTAEKDKYIEHHLLPMVYAPSSSPRDLLKAKTAQVSLKLNHR